MQPPEILGYRNDWDQVFAHVRTLLEQGKLQEILIVSLMRFQTLVESDTLTVTNLESPVFNLTIGGKDWNVEKVLEDMESAARQTIPTPTRFYLFRLHGWKENRAINILVIIHLQEGEQIPDNLKELVTAI